MNYTDKEMITMLTNVCALKFNNVVEYITQKLASRIYYFVINNGGRKEDVQEVLNDALMVAHEFAIKGKFKENTSVQAFVFQVCKYKFRRQIKAEKKAASIYVDDVTYNLNGAITSFEDVDTEYDKNEILIEIINNLKTEDKETLIDFYWKKMTMREIAAKNNLGSEQAARNKLYRIRERLKKYFRTLNETTVWQILMTYTYTVICLIN